MIYRFALLAKAPVVGWHHGRCPAGEEQVSLDYAGRWSRSAKLLVRLFEHTFFPPFLFKGQRYINRQWDEARASLL